MSDPFPLTPSDSQAVLDAVGYSALNALPDWGSIITWNGRTILIFPRTNGTYALTDISGGIPSVHAPGGYIPASVLISDTPRVQTSSWGVFLYSIPQNFYDIALEKAKALSGDLADAAKPLLPTLGISAVIIVGILIFMYGKKS